MSLPSGYKKLEYIESSGTQFIDTGFKPNQDTGFEADFEVIAYDASALCVFGSRNSVNVRYELLARNDDRYQVSYNTSSYSKLPTIINRHSLTMQKNVINLDGISYNASYSTFQINYSFGLFTINNAGTWDSRIPFMRLYSAKLYDNGTLVRNFIPCRTPNREIGLWDDVNGVFYSNSGTGSFLPPADLSPSPPENFRITERSERSVTLMWDAVEDATGYQVYKNGSMVFDQQGTAYTDKTEPFTVNTYELIAYNDDGESDPAMLSYSNVPDDPIPYLITDRTQQDVDRIRELAKKLNAGTATVEELAEWNSIVLKGSYDYSDLNRVGDAVQYLSEILKIHGYDCPVIPKLDWSESGRGAPSDMEQYLQNVQTLRGILTLLPETPNVPADMEKLTWQEANAIEQILVDLESTIKTMLKTRVACGDAYCGGEYL